MSTTSRSCPARAAGKSHVFIEDTVDCIHCGDALDDADRVQAEMWKTLTCAGGQKVLSERRFTAEEVFGSAMCAEPQHSPAVWRRTRTETLESTASEELHAAHQTVQAAARDLLDSLGDDPAYLDWEFVAMCASDIEKLADTCLRVCSEADCGNA